MRRAALFVAALASGCAAPPGPTETCADVTLDRAVLALERGDQTSALGRFAGGCLTEVPPDLALGGDVTLLGAHGRAFVGLDDFGALRSIDPATLALGPALDVYQDHPKPEAVHGIYGVDVDGAGDLWVSRDDVGSMIVLSPGGALVGTVDLSDVDPDGVPDMNGVLVSGDRAYVALGFLDTSNLSDHAKQAGAIAVVDVATRERVDLIQLHGHNPVRALVPADAAGDVVIVATPGVHDAIDGADGIDRAWLDGSHETEQLVSESELGGSVDEVVWGGDDEVYAIVLGPVPGANPTRVVQIDPSRAAGDRVVRVLASAPYYDDPNGAAYVHAGLSLAGEWLLVGDHTPGQPQLLAFRRKSGDPPVAVQTEVLPPAALLALPP